MAKSSHQIMTANRLSDGAVVYLDAQERWVENLAGADVAATVEEAETLTNRAEHAVSARLVVGPYLLPVAPDEPRAKPLSQREHIRAMGPTVGTDLFIPGTGA